ncbi:GAF domain-containing protein [Chloroflexota bacterium]
MLEEQEEKYYHSLFEIAAAVNSAGAPETVLLSIVESVAKALDAKGCSLMLLTPDRKLLLHTAACGLSDWYVRKGPVSADKSIAEALEGRPVSVMYATEDDRIQYRRQAEQEGIASILSVPVLLREEVVGVMRVYTAKPREFANADIYFVGAVANLGAIALENARLDDSVKKDYEELRVDLAEWRAALGYEWLAGESVIPPQE